MITRTLLCLLVVALCLTSAPARAINIAADAKLSSDVVEVGEPVNVQLLIELDEDVVPTGPKLQVPPKFQSGPPSQQSIDIRINNRYTRRYTAHWVLVPNEPGNYTIPAPSAVVQGETISPKAALKLKVVPVGQGGPRRGSGGMGSFFGPTFPFYLDDPFFRFSEPRPVSSEGAALALPQALDERLFLYIRADKKEAVVGEQVTLEYLIYFDVEYAGPIDYREPSLSELFRYAITDAGDRSARLATTVAGKRFYVQKFAEIAVFPMRPGELHTGTFSGKFRAPGLNPRQLVERESNDVVIVAREAPAEGRPVGYQSGTVGRFKLKAEVAPRETVAGETISVRAQVMGIGLMPNQLRVPSRAGIEWLDPERRDETSIQKGRIGGWRSFGYAVRFANAGDYDLGNIELPYFDAVKGEYDVATFEIGKIHVRPSQNPQAALPESGDEGRTRDPWKGLSPARLSLGAFDPPRDDGLAPATLWTLVVTPPLAVLLSGLGASLLARLRRARERTRTDPAALARRALSDMERAGDGKDAAAAAERAVHLALEAATGLRPRAMLLEELGSELAKRGLGDLGAQVVALLGACGQVRFEPTGGGASELQPRAHALVKELLKFEPVPS